MPRFTATRRDDVFTDAHGVDIHFYEWRVGKPRAIVQLSHGLGEHALRYAVLAQELVDAGYTVYANDQRGHGQTGLGQWGGDRTRLGKLGPGGTPAAAAVLTQFTALIRERNPDVPIVLVGHSWGSLLAQITLTRHAGDYAAAVLSGTAYRMPGYMRAGNLNKRHAHLGTTGAEWLSRDAEVAKAFLDDPLTFEADALRLFGIIDGLRVYGRPGRMDADIPLLIMVGDDDYFGGVASSRRLAADYLRRSALSDVQVLVYPEARHEVFNETNRDEVVADLVAWLDAHLPPRR
ncbi:alpha-beta hydrolase superfamily lysophospholipase [Diaminobutyricimonas aerilata]|uniref:Alpha-beta hydrolase superfamily lysophospholipase n=1 Tax=Diaminobutyricimonas aerilata TaxID=1162967 RepID=A0A2M9CFY7_9MICO|nr:alpha/beta hydrolase [Diaminobutyricimonas aerilata]PJJ70765.1 alpha-beta hydrolase superfamily lysophospholipase [Diaminobutyricimonas aerilata]